MVPPRCRSTDAMPIPAADSLKAARPMPRWLRSLVMIAIVLGIVLRFTNVSHKAFGLDEGFTALQISGYGDRDTMEQLVTGQVIGNAALQRFQFPNEERGAVDTVRHLARTAPELPPPYFLMLRGWVGLFGQTVTSLRLFSVALGVLLIPAVYWLCRELFPGTWVGAVAMALVAQSPFHLLSAQEARPYSLWALLIVLSSGALVRALRQQTVGAWAIYSVTLALGFYCHFLHGLVMISHAVFMAWGEWGQWSLSLRRGALHRYVVASLIGGVLFLPWGIFTWVNFDNVQPPEMRELAAQSSLGLGLIKAWVKGANLPLLDFHWDASSSRLSLIGLAVLLGGNWVWMAIALWRFALRAEAPAKQLLLPLVGATAAVLILSDFIPDGQRSGAFRDGLPAVVGLQLIMAFVLARWWVQGPRRWGQVLLVGLLTMGLLSNGVMVMSWDWWSKSLSNANLDLPALVREHGQRQASLADRPDSEVAGSGSGGIAIPAQPPLFVSDAFFVHALAASHALPDEAQWLLVPSGERPLVPGEYRDFYLFAPTAELLAQMQQQYEVEPFNNAYWHVSRD